MIHSVKNVRGNLQLFLEPDSTTPISVSDYNLSFPDAQSK